MTGAPGTVYLTGRGTPGGSFGLQSPPDLGAGRWTTLTIDERAKVHRIAHP